MLRRIAANALVALSLAFIGAVVLALVGVVGGLGSAGGLLSSLRWPDWHLGEAVQRFFKGIRGG